MSDLKNRIQTAQEKRKRSPKENSLFKKSSANVSVEFISSVSIGTAMGYFIDSKFSTRPWFIVAGFILGCTAGFYTVYRYTKAMKEQL